MLRQFRSALAAPMLCTRDSGLLCCARLSLGPDRRLSLVPHGRLIRNGLLLLLLVAGAGHHRHMVQLMDDRLVLRLVLLLLASMQSHRLLLLLRMRVRMRLVMLLLLLRLYAVGRRQHQMRLVQNVRHLGGNGGRGGRRAGDADAAAAAGGRGGAGHGQLRLLVLLRQYRGVRRRGQHFFNFEGNCGTLGGGGRWHEINGLVRQYP